MLHNDINEGKDVPVLAWLLFARDTSSDPCALLRNHLNSVGDTGGLEQVCSNVSTSVLYDMTQKRNVTWTLNSS